MIRIVVTSTVADKPICYHNMTSMREADKMASTYNQMDYIKATVEVTQ